MKKYILIIVAFISFNANSFASVDSVATILKNHIKLFASDSLEGRFPGLSSIQYSENYLIDKYKTYGLLPVNNSYKQEFDVITGKNFGEENFLAFQTLIHKPGLSREHSREITRSLEFNKDYRPMAISENGTAKGEVVFAGFGITATELEYNDYENIDVKDKIVIVITDTPDDDDGFSLYSSNRYKISNAKNHGAIGMIFIRKKGDSMNIFYPLSYRHLGHNTGMIAIQGNRHSIDKFFPKGKKLFDLEKEIRETGQPKSFVLPDTKVQIEVDLEDRLSQTSNIVGMIEGTDHVLKNEFIIIGSHYDHLGYGGNTSRYSGLKPKIHYGADDNASGTAGLLELASRIATHPFKRTVIFVAFTAEEMGTIGSIHFVKSTLYDRENTSVMINLDMIGRLDKSAKELTVFGANTSSSFPNLFNSIENDYLSLKVSNQSFGASDHAPFMRDSLPALHFFTGIHGDYHTPDDTWQKINYSGLAYVVDYVYNISKIIANQSQKMAFNNEVLSFEKAAPRQHGYAKVWFGIVPSFEESELGFKIAGTSPGSPAQKAGLDKNDIIVQIDDFTISNIYDFMFAIKNGKPGDELKVEILRGNELKSLELKVVLVPRN